jgi:hypothetical protein
MREEPFRQSRKMEGRVMLISELIEELQSLQTQHGDLEVEARDHRGDFSDVESVLDEVTRHGITIRIDA